jgi:hypothetical protein
MIKDNFYFHTNTTTTGSGLACHIMNPDPLTTMYVTFSGNGGSGTKTVAFEGLGPNASSYFPVCCTSVLTGSKAVSTSGSMDEQWYANVSGLDYFRCNVTAISSGSLTAIGRLVSM